MSDDPLVCEDDAEKVARYRVYYYYWSDFNLEPISKGQSTYWFYYHLAAFDAIEYTSDTRNKSHKVTITDMNGFPLAEYRDGRRTYHFTESPDWITQQQAWVNLAIQHFQEPPQ